MTQSKDPKGLVDKELTKIFQVYYVSQLHGDGEKISHLIGT